MTKFFIFITLVASAPLGCAQSIVGDWRGVVKFAATEHSPSEVAHIAFHVRNLNADRVSATMDFYAESGDIDLGRPVDSVTLTESESRVKFGFENRIYYEGTITADGTMIHGNWWDHDPYPVDLKRVTAADRGEPVKPLPFDGTWKGILDNYPERRTVVFHFTNTVGGPRVAADGLSSAMRVPATRLTLEEGTRLELEFDSIHAHCWGVLDQSRTTWHGQCNIGHGPLVLKRDTGTQDEPPRTDFGDALDNCQWASAHSDLAVAVKFCEKAVALQPDSMEARRQLGRSELHLYTPSDPKGKALIDEAEENFHKALELSPQDKISLGALAYIAWERSTEERQDTSARLNQAKTLIKRICELDPQNSEAFYFLGVIDWSQAYPQWTEARRQLRMKPQDPGPLPDPRIRMELRNRIEALYEDAIQQFSRAVRIVEATPREDDIPNDPLYSDALAYLNLCFFEKADLADNRAAYARNMDEAEGWFQKAREAMSHRSTERRSGSIFEFPPPPPPSAQPSTEPVGKTDQTKRGGLGTVLEPPPPGPAESSSTAVRIQVKAEVMQGKLMRKVEPIFPPLARQAQVQGIVQFKAIIGTDGAVKNLALLSGHPLLVSAAQQAARQWQYRPTLLDGEPVEVETQIEVTFRSSK